MDTTTILDKFNDLERLIIVHSKKRALTLEETSVYTGLSKSTLYKLTSSNQIPYSKLRGKTLYFDKEKLDKWLLQNPQKTQDEIDREAADYVHFNKGL
ncbi:helix-turn-helix domain-containing protein [Membranihabitans maritimus]|uniref:helix-turn-helix domain-containing protein n=1 Tax=Membranihabitans maritimus TaxID=2904244 RepID=UPI001F444288|nr:helix-turn-helix domain-containing protein [Membranihabitans maritimus]